MESNRACIVTAVSRTSHWWISILDFSSGYSSARTMLPFFRRTSGFIDVRVAMILLVIAVTVFSRGVRSVNGATNLIPDEDGLKALSQSLGNKLVSFTENATGFHILTEAYKDAAAGSEPDIVLEEVDGEQIVQQTAETLAAIFQKKVDALKKAVVFAEKLGSEYKWDKNLKGVLYLHANSGSENIFETAGNDTNPLEFNEQFNQEVIMDNSSIHVPLDIYRDDVVIQNNIAWTSGLDEIWKRNRDEDQNSNLHWQYFGSHTGILRFHPGAKWMGNPVGKSKVDLYDVRRRPWYTQGASSPKDMLILIDKSGSSHGQALALMKHAIRSIIETLGENDFVNVANFSSEATWNGCFSTFVQANRRNKKILLRQVADIEAYGVANYTNGLEFAFNQFEQFERETNESESEGAHCNKIIMFLTDGGTEMPEELFKARNPNKQIRIFTYAVGPFANPISAVRWIACNSRGKFYQIPAMGAIRSTVQSPLGYLSPPLKEHNQNNSSWSMSILDEMEYADVLSNGIHVEAPNLVFWAQTHDDEMDYVYVLSGPQALAPPSRVTWTPIYKGELGLGLVTSVTAPVFNRSMDSGNETILGVMGVDVSIDELQAALPNDKFGPTGYAFALNANGYVLFHPSLVLSKEGVNDIPNVDFVEIEDESEEKLMIRKKMVDQETDSATITSYTLGLDEHHADKKAKTYWYTGISNTPFSVAVVLPDYVHYYVSSVKQVDVMKAVQDLEASIDAALFPGIQYEKLCPGIEPMSNLSTVAELEDFIEFLRVNSSACDGERLRSILFDITMTSKVVRRWTSAAPTPPREDGDDEQPTIEEIANDDKVAQFVSTNGGLSWVYPKNDSTNEIFARQAIDPSKQPFYRRAFDNSDIWLYTALANYTADSEDMNKTGVVIQAVRAISIKPSLYTHRVGVIGVHMSPQKIAIFINDSVPQCRDDRLRCYLIDDGAQLVFSSESDTEPSHKIGTFLGKLEPLLMQHLIDDSVFINATKFDYQGVCTEDENTPSSAIRLLPSLLYELLTFNWWTTASTWTYIAYLNIYSWLFLGTHGNVIETPAHGEGGEEPVKTFIPRNVDPPDMSPVYHSCIRGIYPYHLNADESTHNAMSSGKKSSISCKNCSRSYAIIKIPDSNLVLVLIDDESKCPVDWKDCNPSDLKYESNEDPINADVNCTSIVRYRRRPPCYDSNPHINMSTETYCHACSLYVTTSRFLLVTAPLAAIFMLWFPIAQYTQR